jgi:tetratricopeptide (TPR) repeat protein
MRKRYVRGGYKSQGVVLTSAQVDCYQRAVRLDQYLAVAYFQQGVSNFLMGDFEEALANFNDTLLYLRGNNNIDCIPAKSCSTAASATSTSSRGTRVCKICRSQPRRRSCQTTTSSMRLSGKKQR